jgi:hypothetical protein
MDSSSDPANSYDVHIEHGNFNDIGGNQFNIAHNLANLNIINHHNNGESPKLQACFDVDNP